MESPWGNIGTSIGLHDFSIGLACFRPLFWLVGNRQILRTILDSFEQHKPHQHAAQGPKYCRVGQTPVQVTMWSSPAALAVASELRPGACFMAA